MSIFAKLREGVSTSSAEETQALGFELARSLPAESTLALHGDLGVGKTTFVQGLARGFGIRVSVTSPTYTIFNLYRGEKTTTALIHLDAYRLESARQIDSLMLDDFLTTPYCLAVEWPERIAEWLPAETIHLRLGIETDMKHRVQVVQSGNALDDLRFEI
jgi:tRNA threonylcarbamoyladenosine biosynthesis protein TsaE